MALGMLNVKQDNMPKIAANFGYLWKGRDVKLTRRNYLNHIDYVTFKEEKNIMNL